jgi:hypothetical protein
MGCDIHSHAEKRNKETGAWEKVHDCFLSDEFHRREYGKDRTDEPFVYRNYNLFAFLAGVRNRIGCVPISFPKGIPDDVSDEVRHSYNLWNYDSHSASYLYLREMLEYNYDEAREYLSEDYFKVIEELKAIGDPDDVRVVFWFDN